MALSIVNNSTAIGAQGSVNKANTAFTKTIKALSTGLRINTASDDASGLAVSEKLRAQISGLAKAASNAQDAMSMLQTAEGAMDSMNGMIQRMRDLAIQAGNPAYTTNDRAMLQLEVDQLREEIDRVSNTTEFNTKKLLNGDASGYWSSSSNKLEAILTGAVQDGSYVVSATVSAGSSSKYQSNDFVFVNSANVTAAATGNTILSAVTSFIDSSGNFILKNTQELTIYANGSSTSIFLGQGDTLSSVRTKLSSAMEELGLISANNTTAVSINGGQLSIQSTLATGDNSNITFVGSESLIKALGIKQTEQGKNDTVTVTVRSSAGATAIGSYKTQDGIARNIIDGVDLKLNGIEDGDEFNLSVKNNATKAIIGANEGQTLDISIGRIDTVSLGIDNINITNIQDAENALGKLSLAIDEVNKARSTIGAQVNRLDYTVTNLNTTRENMIASESRIRDLDIAQASSDLAAQQVVLQSATAMLAQANTIPSYALQLLA